ncbi:glycosyltransferase family 2 protein [Candidatus Woesearchaeota archaeon]|nr:glycosyltransferase family 2 protein [Candidatus Woesearchaeota archaeon]
MKVIVTIPAYNEEKTLPAVIQGIKTVLAGQRWKSEILVANDGSTDGTAAVAKAAGASVVSHGRNYGLGETFNTEIKECLRRKADVIVHIDADGQYLPEEIPRLVEKVEEGYDLVLGSRFLGHIESMPWLKRFGNKAFSRVISNIIRQRITDGQTGFRAFTAAVARNVQIHSGHTYTQEQILRAAKQKYRVTEVPVYFAKRSKGKSRLIKHPLEYAAKAGINILRVYRDYEPLRFFGICGACFVIPGLLLGMWLVYNFVTQGVVGRIPTLMLTVLTISVGFQIWLFGFLADKIR